MWNVLQWLHIRIKFNENQSIDSDVFSGTGRQTHERVFKSAFYVQNKEIKLQIEFIAMLLILREIVTSYIFTYSFLRSFVWI
jgi:hypothetical protein